MYLLPKESDVFQLTFTDNLCIIWGSKHILINKNNNIFFPPPVCIMHSITALCFANYSVKDTGRNVMKHWLYSNVLETFTIHWFVILLLFNDQTSYRNCLPNVILYVYRGNWAFKCSDTRHLNLFNLIYLYNGDIWFNETFSTGYYGLVKYTDAWFIPFQLIMNRCCTLNKLHNQ